MRSLNETYGIKVVPTTVLNYLKRYEKLLTEYMTNCLKPQFSGHVNIDELWIKIDGQMKYLFAALDPDTRYLLCTVLSQRKDYKGARRLFEELSKITGHGKTAQTIKTITTDAMPSYKYAFQSQFITDSHTNSKNPPKLIFGAGVRGPIDNNISERVNNTIRTRERNYRGLKVDDTAMLPLFVAYYNLIRDHQALGKTPAEAAGIKLKGGKDRWLELIKQANEWQNNVDDK